MGSWAVILRFGQALLLVGQVGQVPKTISESNAEHAKKIKKSNEFQKASCPKKILPRETFENHEFSSEFQKGSLNMSKIAFNFRKHTSKRSASKNYIFLGLSSFDL